MQPACCGSWGTTRPIRFAVATGSSGIPGSCSGWPPVWQIAQGMKAQHLTKTKASRYEPQINRSYQDLATHYGAAVLPTRPYKPRDKAKAEIGVQVVERWILARLRHFQFFSLVDLMVRVDVRKHGQGLTKKVCSGASTDSRCCKRPPRPRGTTPIRALGLIRPRAKQRARDFAVRWPLLASDRTMALAVAIGDRRADPHRCRNQARRKAKCRRP